MTTYADGAPAVPRHDPWDGDPDPSPTPGSAVGRAVKTASRVRQFEGWRGYSNRTLVAVRQVGAVALLIGTYLLARWSFAPRAEWKFGAEMMLFSVAFIQLCATIGTVIYAESRFKIIEQARHFTFGIVALPAAALSVFMRIVNTSLPTGDDSNVFTGVLLGNGLPLVYFSVVIIPAFVFAKYIFGGLRTVNRKALADEESLAAFMRQDRLQR